MTELHDHLDYDNDNELAKKGRFAARPVVPA